ncbi:hypothetical protein H6P81_005360 [Aristolochia fimbriata]|uniref:Uncharacterized protein n=1 Tax=Aristolochia fimbriata TaxID=158543 RepID=A0AAV7EX33_ARIFI|nr:hypothetical protein H6P81_005360 [Aristolochia fimbriata]
MSTPAYDFSLQIYRVKCIVDKMAATLEDIQLKMVVMQARLDGPGEEAPAAEDALATEEAPPGVGGLGPQWSLRPTVESAHPHGGVCCSPRRGPKEGEQPPLSVLCKRKVKPSKAMIAPYVLTHTSKRTKKTNC